MALKLRAGAVAVVAMVAMGTAADARPKAAAKDAHCAKPQEMSAIQVATVQQELMVAALTCNAVTDFNAFQTAYLADLRISDKRLADMFRRVFGRKGEGEYHAFKTRLANNASMRAIHDADGYCQEARQVFTAVQVPSRPTLAEFVAAVTSHDETPVESCEAAGTVSAASAEPMAVPDPNPLRTAEYEAAAAPAAPATAVTPPVPAADAPKRMR